MYIYHHIHFSSALSRQLNKKQGRGNFSILKRSFFAAGAVVFAALMMRASFLSSILAFNSSFGIYLDIISWVPIFQRLFGKERLSID